MHALHFPGGWCFHHMLPLVVKSRLHNRGVSARSQVCNEPPGVAREEPRGASASTGVYLLWRARHVVHRHPRVRRARLDARASALFCVCTCESHQKVCEEDVPLAWHAAASLACAGPVAILRRRLRRRRKHRHGRCDVSAATSVRRKGAREKQGAVRRDVPQVRGLEASTDGRGCVRRLCVKATVRADTGSVNFTSARSIEDPAGFWADIAEDFYWHKKWDEVGPDYNFDMDKGDVHISWFRGAKTNVCYNAVDRHVEAGRGNKTALIWEGNSPEESHTVTFSQLKDRVSKLANWLKANDIKKGDDVTMYLPMITELPESMLACARIGAVHSVVFAGFSAEALASRMIDCKTKILLTCSSVMRGKKKIVLKDIVDRALEICESKGFHVETVLVHPNERVDPRTETNMKKGRDRWWDEEVNPMSADCPVEWVDAEDPLFKLYTSGSTGTPKGVLHTTAGYMVGAATTFKYVFDYQPDDVYWCTADCGWITGHSYLTYGPLVHGATTLMFEGVPTYPDAGRCWEVIDKWGVTLFYTAPTAIRSLMGFGDEFVTKYSRKTLRVLGSVGEPINPTAWHWYHSVVGGGRCRIVDTWWQTETGAHMITPLPGAFDEKPGSASFPFFGVVPVIVDEKGNELEGECEGILLIKKPWPSIMRTVAGDHKRFEKTYFSAFKGYFFTSDGCRRDKDGYYWITGRVDDVINVSGHRIGTAEVESALVSHEGCVEAAVVGYDHPVKGQGIYAYVTLLDTHEPSDELKMALKNVVRSVIGPFATPDVIHWAPALPKTRSGKIMRRILRKIAGKKDHEIGDTSTLADPQVVDVLISLRGK